MLKNDLTPCLTFLAQSSEASSPSQDLSGITTHQCQSGNCSFQLCKLKKGTTPFCFHGYFQKTSLNSKIMYNLNFISDLPMEEQLRRLQEERTCKVCMDKEVNIVFIPCGHLVVCKECAPSLRKCPICRGLVKGTVRTFLS